MLTDGFPMSPIRAKQRSLTALDPDSEPEIIYINKKLQKY